MKWTLLFISVFLVQIALGQQKSATVSGTVLDEEDRPIAAATITILGTSKGTTTDEKGYFTIIVKAQQALALIVSHAGYALTQKNFYLSIDEEEIVQIKLFPSGKTLEEVTVKDDALRKELGLIKINPKNAITLPSTTGGVEALIKTLVGSNNELSSQYSVRGGNYDENLVYINDFEVFRPYLVSSGQQEGLSLINPALTKNVSFYTGGFQAKYGDKMSSVLDIEYKTPKSFGGSAYISLLEQGAHIEGTAKHKKVSYLLGARNKSNRNLLSNQPTQGSYLPAASDVQGLLTYRANRKFTFDILTIFSQSSFSYLPESVKKTSAVFSPFFTSAVGLDINFEGQEKDFYSSRLLAASMQYSPVEKLKLKWMLSHFKNKENENFDIAGDYLFGERNFDNSSSTFGQITSPLGAGYYQNYARNTLEIEVTNASLKGSLDKGKHYIQWGNAVEFTKINDELYQFEYQDSAGYSLPYTPGPLTLFNTLQSKANLSIQKYSGYVQDNIHLLQSKQDISLQIGARYNYNSLNKEFLVSPRAQVSWQPAGKKDIVYKLAAGVYNQPPFYRELRRYDGSINEDIKAQKSVQFVGGVTYNFKGKDGRPFRLATEAYYKQMRDVVPYDVDNVKIRYLGANNAKAYTMGAEMRLFGELTRGAESWLSLGIMRSRENLNDDRFTTYKNAAGEVIGGGTIDQVATDSSSTDVGYLRRPTDRLITAGLYIEDYLSTNKNFKTHLNIIYGSNMSYNIPNSVRYRNGLIIEPYIRVDVGFSALLLSEKSQRRSHNPFRGFDNIWLSAEVFNLINRANTISYQLIKDFSNATYAIPNRLTPRLINIKLVARF